MLAGVLSDRMITARKESNRVKFETKPLCMLESLILGYLNGVSSYKLDLKLIANCLRYLDTNAISAQLLKKLKSLRLTQHANFLQRSQP